MGGAAWLDLGRLRVARCGPVAGVGGGGHGGRALGRGIVFGDDAYGGFRLGDRWGCGLLHDGFVAGAEWERGSAGGTEIGELSLLCVLHGLVVLVGNGA